MQNFHQVLRQYNFWASSLVWVHLLTFFPMLKYVYKRPMCDRPEVIGKSLFHFNHLFCLSFFSLKFTFFSWTSKMTLSHLAVSFSFDSGCFHASIIKFLMDFQQFFIENKIICVAFYFLPKSIGDKWIFDPHWLKFQHKIHV